MQRGILYVVYVLGSRLAGAERYTTVYVVYVLGSR